MMSAHAFSDWVFWGGSTYFRSTTLLSPVCLGTVNDCFPLLPVFDELWEFTTPITSISFKDVNVVLCWSSLRAESRGEKIM